MWWYHIFFKTFIYCKYIKVTGEAVGEGVTLSKSKTGNSTARYGSITTPYRALCIVHLQTFSKKTVDKVLIKCNTKTGVK